MSNPRIILTLPRGGAQDDASVALIEDLQEIAQLQNVQFQKLDRLLSLGKRFHEGYEAESEAATQALDAKVAAFAEKHGLERAAALKYFGGTIYPTDESIPVFEANYRSPKGWQHALSEPIGNRQKFANLLPAGIPSAQALTMLSAPAIAELPQLQGETISVVQLDSSARQVTHAAETLQNGLTVDLVRMPPEQALAWISNHLNINIIAPDSPDRPPAADSSFGRGGR